jgi:hypothetical protein
MNSSRKAISNLKNIVTYYGDENTNSPKGSYMDKKSFRSPRSKMFQE